MGWHAVIWRVACWAWVGLPILGVLPGIPVRLATQWLGLVGSMVVVGLGLACPRRSGTVTPAGVAILLVVGLALLHWQQPTAAFLWAWQASLLFAAAAVLAVQGKARWLNDALIACAWGQLVVMALQLLKVPLPFPRLHPDSLVGTVGSIRPASILIGLASVWSRGWPSWVLGTGACLTGSGTVVPVILLRRWWPYRRHPLGWLAGLSLLVGGAQVAQHWLVALSERAQVWTTWPLTWWGIGFTPFPAGFQDDTAFGHAMQWRDAHNVWLDWVGRFGLPGVLVCGVAGWWVWTRRPDPWTLGFLLWVSCWQSLEQFPVLMIAVVVWMIGLAEGAKAESFG